MATAKVNVGNAAFLEDSLLYFLTVFQTQYPIAKKSPGHKMESWTKMRGKSTWLCTWFCAFFFHMSKGLGFCMTQNKLSQNGFS